MVSNKGKVNYLSYFPCLILNKNGGQLSLKACHLHYTLLVRGQVLSVSPPQGCVYTALLRGKYRWLRVRPEAALVSGMQDLWPEIGASDFVEGVSKWQLHTLFEKK